MIETIESPAGHLVSLRTSDRITKRDIDRAFAALNAALSDHDRVSLYLELTSLDSISPEALLKDLRYGFGQVKNLNRFYRIAVVTDRKWVRKAASWQAKLVPTVELRTFSLSERATATTWAGETPPPREGQIERLPTNQPGLIGYAVRGPITGPIIEQMLPDLEAALEAQNRIRMLVRLESEHYPRVHLDALKGSLFSLKRKALRRVDRYAVVGGPAWVKTTIELLNPLFRMDVRHFDRDEEDVAWHWLGASPSGRRAGDLNEPAE